MVGLNYAAAAVAAVLLMTAVSVPAEANRRCGYDRYGYNAPDFSGCYPLREAWGFYPGYGVYPEPRYYGPPRYDAYYGPPVCHYDNGYDMRVRLICTRGW